MINKIGILTITGILLTITGILDAYKYHWSASSIRKIGTAKGQSRKFINAALVNDIIRIVHCSIIPDWYLVVSSLLALGFMLEHWFVVYQYYPYRKRGLINFKRPNLILYVINSFLPNQIRRRL